MGALWCGVPALLCAGWLGAPPVGGLARRARLPLASTSAPQPDDDESWESATWEVAVRFADEEEPLPLPLPPPARVAPSAGPARGGASAEEPDELEWDEPLGTPEEEDDDSAISVTDFFPLLLERKYGANWESLVEEAEREDGIKINANSEYIPGSAEDLVGYNEDELREMVRKVQLAEENGEEVPGPAGMDAYDAAEYLAAEELAAERAEAEARMNEMYDSEEETAPRKDTAAGKARSGGAGRKAARGRSMAEGVEFSPSLVAYVEDLSRGEVKIPSTFPETEWLHVWACATSHKRFRMISATYANLRVLLHENFADFDSLGPTEELSPRDLALLKANAVFSATGMPAISESTVVYVEAGTNKPQSERVYVDADSAPIDALLGRARPISEQEREVIYITETVFVSGNVSLHGYGELRMPMAFASSDHVAIAQSSAHNDLFVKVCETTGLEFVGNAAFDEFYEMQNSAEGRTRKKTAGTALLQERLLRDATILDADILKVSSFVNHMVDVEMMEACGEELAERFEREQPTKVLTVEATGLLPAVFVAKALGLPCIFARKQRQISISDSYQTSYKSSVSSSVQDLYVSTEYLSPGDRVLIIDDFLAGGRTADAMIRLCRMANANVVGGGFLIEKVNDAGRAFLSGYQIPLESIALVSIDDGTISIVEQEERPPTTGTAQSSVDVSALSNFDLLEDGDDYDDFDTRGMRAERI